MNFYRLYKEAAINKNIRDFIETKSLLLKKILTKTIYNLQFTFNYIKLYEQVM